MVGVPLAATAVGAALVLTLALRPVAEAGGESLFLLAVAGSALAGGLVPGLVALALSTAAINWWLLPPDQAFGYRSTSDLLGQVVFAAAGLLIVALAGRARALQLLAVTRGGEAEFKLEGAEGRLVEALRRAEALERRQDETVLIVDPDPEARRVTSHVVEAAGYRWVSACDGVEALELLDRYSIPFALVVTEVRLPDIPAPELARRIAERRPGLRVLYVASAAAGSQAGPVDELILTKPFTPRELVRYARAVAAQPASSGPVA